MEFELGNCYYRLQRMAFRQKDLSAAYAYGKAEQLACGLRPRQGQEQFSALADVFKAHQARASTASEIEAWSQALMFLEKCMKRGY